MPHCARVIYSQQLQQFTQCSQTKWRHWQCICGGICACLCVCNLADSIWCVPFNLTCSFVATANTATASCTYAKPAKNEHLFTIFIYLLTFIPHWPGRQSDSTMSAAFWQRNQQFAARTNNFNCRCYTRIFGLIAA